MSFPVHEAHQIAPELLGIEARTEILHAYPPVGIDERCELRMLDRAVLLLREEYPIATCHVTDRLERACQEAPPLGLGAPELRVILQHLRRVALGIEGDRNKGDLGAKRRPQ